MACPSLCGPSGRWRHLALPSAGGGIVGVSRFCAPSLGDWYGRAGGIGALRGDRLGAVAAARCAFKWKPYYEEMLAGGDCAFALSLLTFALNTYEIEAARTAAAVGAEPSCSAPELRAKAVHLSNLGTSLLRGFDDAQTRKRFEKRRAAGWRRHWNDPGGVWFFFKLFAGDHIKAHPTALGFMGAPFAALGRLHCDYSLGDGPQGAYFLMRVDLARDLGFNELRLPTWERRVRACWTPAQAGYLLDRPRKSTQSQTPEQPKTPQHFAP